MTNSEYLVIFIADFMAKVKSLFPLDKNRILFYTISKDRMVFYTRKETSMPYRVTERTEQRRQAMRKRIITAARDLFVRQGYQPTTMQQIVQEAGTSIGNCYFYFS